MEPILCPACNDFFIPRNKCQIFCSTSGCQRVRKSLWQKQKIATDPEYKEGHDLSQNKWLLNNPGYWKGYRFRNPEKASRNRSLQKIRNMKNRRDQATSQLSKTIRIAKMDARRSRVYNLSGQYWLIPTVAKMDAVKIFITTAPTNAP